MTDRVLFYPVVISTHARRDDESPVKFGPPCNEAGAAARYVKDEIAAGNASFGVVACFADGERRIMDNNICPATAAKAVKNYLRISRELE